MVGARVGSKRVLRKGGESGLEEKAGYKFERTKLMWIERMKEGRKQADNTREVRNA